MPEVPYRPLIPSSIAEEKKSYSRDESDYATLVAVQKAMENSLESLKHDFNAFEVLGEGDPEVVGRKLLIDIESRQISYHLIANLKSMVDSAIQRVDSINTN